MKIGQLELLNLIQGTEEWLDFRRNHYPASEAPAVMGAGKFDAKNAYDLAEIRLGIRKIELSAFKEQLFERGHECEEKARPIVETMIGEPLSPVVGRREVEGLPLVASSDGLNFDKSTNFEHKMWNESLAKAVDEQSIGPEYYWQLEHQALVFGSQNNIFVCSDGTVNRFKFMIYNPVPGRAEELVKGWKRFEKILFEMQQDDPEWKELAEPVREVKEKIAELKEQIKLLEKQIDMDKIIEFAERKGLSQVVGAGLRLKRTVAKGSVDYKAMEKQGINVDEFRKPPVERWRLDLIN